AGSIRAGRLRSVPVHGHSTPDPPARPAADRLEARHPPRRAGHGRRLGRPAAACRSPAGRRGRRPGRPAAGPHRGDDADARRGGAARARPGAPGAGRAARGGAGPPRPLHRVLGRCLPAVAVPLLLGPASLVLADLAGVHRFDLTDLSALRTRFAPAPDSGAPWALIAGRAGSTAVGAVVSLPLFFGEE